MTPNPPEEPAMPSPKPLVEAWAVRHPTIPTTLHREREGAEWEAADVPSTVDGTVVPLIAADRLSDPALIKVASSALLDYVERSELPEDAARNVLAALRAHLEGL